MKLDYLEFNQYYLVLCQYVLLSSGTYYFTLNQGELPASKSDLKTTTLITITVFFSKGFIRSNTLFLLFSWNPLFKYDCNLFASITKSNVCNGTSNKALFLTNQPIIRNLTEEGVTLSPLILFVSIEKLKDRYIMFHCLCL